MVLSNHQMTDQTIHPLYCSHILSFELIVGSFHSWQVSTFDNYNLYSACLSFFNVCVEALRPFDTVSYVMSSWILPRCQ